MIYWITVSDTYYVITGCKGKQKERYCRKWIQFEMKKCIYGRGLEGIWSVPNATLPTEQVCVCERNRWEIKSDLHRCAMRWEKRGCDKRLLLFIWYYRIFLNQLRWEDSENDMCTVYYACFWSMIFGVIFELLFLLVWGMISFSSLWYLIVIIGQQRVKMIWLMK